MWLDPLFCIQTQDRKVIEGPPGDWISSTAPTLQFMERPDYSKHLSNGSSGSGGVPVELSNAQLAPPRRSSFKEEDEEDLDETTQFTPGSTISNLTPLTGTSSLSWSSQTAFRTKSASSEGSHDSNKARNSMQNSRAQRPSGPARTPSNTYNPPRRPSNYVSVPSNRHRSFSNPRRRDPNAQYRAQEKAYIQQLRQDPANEYYEDQYTPSLAYSTDSEPDEESPSSEAHFDNENYDQDVQLFYNSEDIMPSVEDLQVPENRERLEWHSMLASVLRGDVVKQEKQRIEGPGERRSDRSVQNNEIWVGVRARCCGRSLAAQKRMIEEGRLTLPQEVEAIIAFQIKGEAEAGKPAAQQVEDVVQKIERCENLYSTRQELAAAIPRAGSEAFESSSSAVIAWHNTTELINTELAILQNWVGNEELDFAKQKTRSPEGAGLTDDTSFLDRIHKDDGLKSLHGKNNMLLGVASTIGKAKATLIENAQAFAARHLPPYIEELLTLINFPSRLILEIIRMRLNYAHKNKDPFQVSPLIAEQVLSQFQTLLKLAIKIKQDYIVISLPEPGWELPPCIDENFDNVVLEALKFYFRLLNSKLVGNKNTFKEAEILESEWDFCNLIGQALEGGDVEVAEQFSGLTAKAMARITMHFEKELTRRPEEDDTEVDKRYKAILDSARVRQRKLFRFSRLLGQRLENATEFSIAMEPRKVMEICESLMASGHFIIDQPGLEQSNLYLIASPTLYNRPKDIQAILGSSFNAEDDVEDPSYPYVLCIRPDKGFFWDSKRMEVHIRAPTMDIRPGKLRLIADGSTHRLDNARLAFLSSLNVKLDVVTDMRANLPRVHTELIKIKKTAYKLSNTIMDSVEIIRRQTKGQKNQELIHTCFVFATEFGMRSVTYMDQNRRQMNNIKLTRLSLDWVSFICDECVGGERKTFKWAVQALEFAMQMTQGPNILHLTDDEFTRLRTKVAGCMSLLISHFDIMGARSTLAAQAEKRNIEASSKFRKFDVSKMKDDAEASHFMREQWAAQLCAIDEARKQKDAERQALGRVLEASNDAERSLAFLSSSATNVSMRWQQGAYIGGGTFGSVYAAVNLDSNHYMAVKEIRLQDPQMIPQIAGQIRDEQAVLEVLDHPNIVEYYGIEVHRDKVYIFMEFCSGGSLANLLEHGRIEDETVIQVYALQMLEGMAYLHQNGIAHRDIKPESKSSPQCLEYPILKLTFFLHRHPPRPQRHNQIRRLRRRQDDCPPRQNPPTNRPLSTFLPLSYQQHHPQRPPAPQPPHRPAETEIHERHPHVHVPRSHQGNPRRSSRRY